MILTTVLPMFLPPKITGAHLSGVLTELSICILDSCSDTHRFTASLLSLGAEPQVAGFGAESPM